MTQLFDKMDPHARHEIEAKVSERSREAFAVEAYMAGYSQAVYDFAIWRNGEQLVGALGRHPQVVINEKRRQITGK